VSFPFISYCSSVFRQQHLSLNKGANSQQLHSSSLYKTPSKTQKQTNKRTDKRTDTKIRIRRILALKCDICW